MSANGPTLFPMDDVPKRGVGKSKAELRAFCVANGIRTHSTGEPDSKEMSKWVAVKVPPKNLADGRQPIPDSVAGMFGQFGRLLDDGGWAGYGGTEREAVEAVCNQRQIPFNP
jgi:hypothetical protein